MRTNRESGIPDAQQVEFYRDYIFPAIKEAGRILDLRGWAVAGGMIEAARTVGVSTRVSTKYWAEDLGRPYQPAETYAGYSYLNFLEKPRSYQFYWELWGLGSHRLLLWGSPDYVRRAVPTFRLAGSIGFEIDPPLAQKGFGNRPGQWGVFTPAQQKRVFWKHEFERYWLFYQLWGRLSYDPRTPDSVWLAQLERRFGAASQDVFEAYRQSSRAINEIVAAHLADPSMYLWPEINPGGLIDAYKDVLPSDWRYIASIPEAVRNHLSNTPSAKQTAMETAARLEEIAAGIEKAAARATAKITSRNREWEGSEPDFQVLAMMARYHAHKQRSAFHVAWFDATADRAALDAARKELTAGLAIWEKLAAFTDGLYPAEMAFGPDDVGHWKDKLPYVRHDLELIRERQDTYNRFGRFDFAFDFGAPVTKPPGRPSYRGDPYVRQYNVAPRFLPTGPDTRYDEAAGYGWASDGKREAVGIPLTPYLEVRAAAKDPKNLPRDVLFRDYIRGEGEQVFQVKAPAGRYSVAFLHPDRSSEVAQIRSQDGFLRIRLPKGEWSVSGVVIKGPKSQEPVSHYRQPKVLPRPQVAHEAPTSAVAGQPLTLSLRITPVDDVTAIRLHYRAVNQNARFKTIEGRTTFSIPAEDVSSRWDLMYYFEVLNRENNGWFQPDPRVATPYYVVSTQGAGVSR
jgi:hypothetical protein